MSIVTPVAYCRDPYKKRGSFLSTQNREHITLGLDAAKSTDFFEKCFEQKLSKITFPTKNSVTHISISRWNGAMGVNHLPSLKYIALEWEWQIFGGL